MPFDFKKFDAKCANMSIDELQREWEHYTRLISGSATSTAVSGAAIPFTLGVSAVGIGLAAPAIHNARKKREIIDRHLQRLGTTHHTRKRDVVTPMAISGTVGLVTLGVGSAGAGAITNAAVEHGIASIAANEIAVEATVHLGVAGIAMVGEEHHMNRKRMAKEHIAYLKQQEKKENDEKVNQSTISVYDPSTFANQSHSTLNSGSAGDVKYEYSPVPIPTPTSEAVPPPYSPPSNDVYQNYFPASQQFTEKPVLNGTTTYYPPSPQNFDTKTTYHTSPLESAHTRPQPHPVQVSLYQAQYSQYCSPASTSSDFHAESTQLIHQHSLSSIQTSTNQGPPQTPNTYAQTPMQQTPQLMYPSYPTTTIPSAAQEHYGRLDQVMSELTISSIHPPPPTPMQSPAPSVQTSKPPPPTTRGYITQPQRPQQPPSQNNSYFPPPTPISPASPVYYEQQPDTSCLSPMTIYHPQPSIPSRSPSISSIGSYLPYSPVQEQPTTFNQYGYMTPVPTPGSQYVQGQPQRYSSVSGQYQTQVPPLQASKPMQPSYATTAGYPTPLQTPSVLYPQNPTPHNYMQSPQQQPEQQQPISYQPQQPPQSHPQPSPSPIQGTWQPPQTYNNTYPPPSINQGYPTPSATPAHTGTPGQQRESVYFPPPPPPPPSVQSM